MTNTQQPLVSICIPTYNGAKYIAESVACARNQTYTNIEIIITDDQSTDNTLEICTQLAKEDSRIKVYQNKQNLGLVGNWCEVIHKTSKNSEWIKYLFQDDLMNSNTVEEMINGALNNNVNFVLTDRAYFFEDGTSDDIKKGYHNIPKTGEIFKESKKYTPLETAKLIKPTFFHNCTGEPPCIMFKKSEFSPTDFDSEFIQLVDYIFVLEKILADDFYFVNQKLVQFRVHGSSQTSKNTQDPTKSVQTFHKYLHVHHYEKIKICLLLLNNPKYKNVLTLIGKTNIIRIKDFIVYKCYYKNYHQFKEIKNFFKSTGGNHFIDKPMFYITLFIKYKIKKKQCKELFKAYKL